MLLSNVSLLQAWEPITKRVVVAHPVIGSAGGEMVPCRMQEILAAGDKVSDAWVSRGSLWGLSVLAGSPLHILVQVCPISRPYMYAQW